MKPVQGGQALVPAGAAALAVALYAAPWFLDIFGVMASLWTPAPLLALYMHRGPKTGRMGLGLASLGALLGFYVAGPGAGGLFFLFYAALAGALGEAWGMRLREDWAVAAAALAGLLAMVGIFIGAGIMSGQGLGQSWESHWRAELDAMVGLYSQMGLEAGNPETFREILLNTARLLLKLAPGLMVGGSLLLAWLNLVMVRAWSLKAKAGGVSERPSLNTWKAPEALVWVLIASGALMVLTGGGLFWLGANLLMILGAIYFFQGLAVVAFWLELKKAPFVLRLLIYSLVAVEFMLAIIIAALGLFDMWFNFRRLGVKPAS